MNPLIFRETQELAASLGEDKIRFVGGCVRNLIAGMPVNDIDIATSLTPEQVIYQCQKAGLKYIPTGIKHGTITVLVRNYEFEVTTLRKDVSTDGRHATVQFVDDWESDAMRRDFTINAFYLDINGRLTDYFGGMDHLKSGKIVFIGDPEQRIKEDYLRILRYFRFMGQFGGNHPPDDSLARIFARNAFHINQLSGERIQDEMFKILCGVNVADTLFHMQNCGVLPFIFPGDVSFETLKNLESLEEKTTHPLRRLAAIEGYDTNALTFHWKFSREQAKILKTLKTDVHNFDVKVVMRNMGKDRLVDLAYLEAARGRLGLNLSEVLDFANTWKIPKFPIYGNDVMTLGVKEGQKVGQILKQLEQYWEHHGYLLSRDELMKRLKVVVNELERVPFGTAANIENK